MKRTTTFVPTFPRHPRVLCAALVLFSAATPRTSSASSEPPGGDLAKKPLPSERFAYPGPADYVITDANIYTENSFHQTVEAIAIRGGKIIFTGNASDAARFIGPKTKVERAQGKLILPGLIDAHIHPMGIVDFGDCSLQSKPRTLAEIATFVGGCVQRMRVPAGYWLMASDWEYGGGNQADRGHPTLRAALDAASVQNPIVLMGWDGWFSLSSPLQSGRLTSRRRFHHWTCLRGFIGASSRSNRPARNQAQDFTLILFSRTPSLTKRNKLA